MGRRGRRSLNPDDVTQTFRFAGVPWWFCQWPPGSVLRTPEERFADLPDFAYEPKYIEVEGLRMAYVEAGTGDPLLLLHGELSWGYSYRHVIPALAKVGRVIVPDLIGFGRSDKPAMPNAYSYKAQVRWLRAFVEAMNLFRVTLVCHDWGGLLGLRLLGEAPLPYVRLVVMNTDLPDGRAASEVFLNWRRELQRRASLDVPQLVGGALSRRKLSEAEGKAYAAPFPSKEYETGARAISRLVPVRPDDPGAYANRLAIAQIQGAKTPNTPALLIWSGEDRLTSGGEAHLRSIFRTVAPPVTIAGAGHFLPEDAGEEVAGHIVRWMSAQPVYGIVKP